MLSLSALGRAGLWLLCLLPLALGLTQALQGRAGPDPANMLIGLTGVWALRFLLITLSLSPLRRHLKLHRPMRYRRMLGLYAWFYASVHFAFVCLYKLGWDWQILVEEFVERPYMMLGILAWLLMVPLGITSTLWARRRMGRYWQSLHRLVYPSVILACLHFVWLVRSDYTEPVIYTLIMLFLLLLRWPWLRARG